jgi:hypothetical protein
VQHLVSSQAGQGRCLAAAAASAAGNFAGACLVLLVGAGLAGLRVLPLQHSACQAGRVLCRMYHKSMCVVWRVLSREGSLLGGVWCVALILSVALHAPAQEGMLARADLHGHDVCHSTDLSFICVAAVRKTVDCHLRCALSYQACKPPASV